MNRARCFYFFLDCKFFVGGGFFGIIKIFQGFFHGRKLGNTALDPEHPPPHQPINFSAQKKKIKNETCRELENSNNSFGLRKFPCFVKRRRPTQVHIICNASYTVR